MRWSLLALAVGELDRIAARREHAVRLRGVLASALSHFNGNGAHVTRGATRRCGTLSEPGSTKSRILATSLPGDCTNPGA
jgi:hypothetical protein